MKHKLFIFLLLCAFVSLSAQTDYYRQELQNLADISRLPLYPMGDIYQLSSYDRTGGNDDGFTGKYSSIREEADGLVMADLKGPGIINRIWTPTPEIDTIKFYFDGEKTPRINIPFIDLFSGKSYPFVAPLCGKEIGGYYCYLPIPYEKSLKIVYAGKKLRFHQTQYRSLPPKEKIKSFSIDLMNANKDIFAKIENSWNKKISPLDTYKGHIKSKKINLTLHSGIEADIFDQNKGGRIVGIELEAGSNLLQAYRKVMFSAQWDNESKKALELPLHDFFGFAFGKPAMQSMLLGANKNKLYSYLPMPFDNSAKLKLMYEKHNADDVDELLISGTIYYTEDKRDSKNEGKLYAQSRREYNTPSGTPYLISDIKGKGHFVGTILVTQGLEDGHTRYFEGDDCTTIDGEMRMHGTGSEDYFNGGYYAVMDKWDRGVSLPIHGSLAYDQMTSRTGGYRFYLSDKMNFNKSLNLTIEHQPEDKQNIKTDYSSVGLFYAEKPQFENTEMRIDNQITKVPYREKLIPQGMLISLYWLATADYQEPGIIFGLKSSKKWHTNVDIDAVPIVQVLLPSLGEGQYKLYIELGKTENGKPFSVWQRSKQISDWIPTDVDKGDTTELGRTIYVGNINITDELNTITLRKKKADDVSIYVYKFLFEKID